MSFAEFSSFFREERKGKGRKVGGKDKNVVFSSFFKKRKEWKENKVDFPSKTFLPNVGEKGRKRKERIEKNLEKLKMFIKLHIYPSITFHCKISKGIFVKIAAFLSFLS